VLAIIAIAAAALGHSLDYWLGRAGSPLLRRWREHPGRRLVGSAVTRAERELARNTGLLILLTRFLLTPFASPVSALAGVERYPFSRYLALEVLGQTIYFCGYLTLGRALGPALARNGLTIVLFFGAMAVIVLLPTLALRFRPGLLGGLRRLGASPADTSDAPYVIPSVPAPLARRRAPHG
jgi:membrane protein DedA with SNARE-associated domain